MTVEPDIPLPPPARGCRFHVAPLPATKVKSYPFADMAVGDSFAAPAGNRTSLKAAASQFGKKASRAFTTRITGAHIRCWRTK
jgi:hypothetical protein